jgi:hypothetical protein
MFRSGLPQGLLNPPRPVAEDAGDDLPEYGRLGQAPGTMILVLIFLAAFALYYFTNWKLLSFVWKIG